MMSWNVYLNSLKLLTRHIVKTALVLLLLSGSIFAQEDKIESKPEPLSDSIFVMQKSPWGAVLRSAIIPGWGQFYTKSYWKIPVIWGVGVWLIYEWNQSNKNIKYYKEIYYSTNNSNYLGLSSDYQDQRDLFSIYIGLTYLLNLVDAYVDAQLFDFSISPDISTKSLMFNMRMNF